jgi:hypothetical protein
MSKKSTQDNVVRVSAKTLTRPAKADLDRLRDAMKGNIDTSDISASDSFKPLKRDPTQRRSRRTMATKKKKSAPKKAATKKAEPAKNAKAKELKAKNASRSKSEEKKFQKSLEMVHKRFGRAMKRLSE